MNLKQQQCNSLITRKCGRPVKLIRKQRTPKILTTKTCKSIFKRVDSRKRYTSREETSRFLLFNNI